MWSARRVGIILAYAAIPLLLVVGSVALAVTEGATTPKTTAAASSTLTPVSRTHTPQPTDTPAPSSTKPSRTMTAKPAASATSSPTSMALTASPTGGARRPGASPTAAPATKTAVSPGMSAAPRTESCGPFASWGKAYVVRPGDTLFGIAVRYRTSVWQLRQANCKDSTAVFPGERLRVPGLKTWSWEHRSLPAFHWHWWERFPWSGRPGIAPVP
jgi:LysM repeat protein